MEFTEYILYSVSSAYFDYVVTPAYTENIEKITIKVKVSGITELPLYFVSLTVECGNFGFGL